MSRYLTAPRTGILALISLYVEDVVPKDAAITVLSFIILSTRTELTVDQDLVLSIEAFEKALSTCHSARPGRTVYDLFLRKLWSIDSLHALHAFFDSLGQLLPKSHDDLPTDAENSSPREDDRILLSKNSPLGALVRRSQLEFTRLQEQDATKLWKSLILYREPTRATCRRRSPDVVRDGYDVNLLDRFNGKIEEILYGDLRSLDVHVSTADVERLLEFQVDQLQSQAAFRGLRVEVANLYAEMGQRLPEKMRDRFEEMVQTGLTVPSLAHYVKFLDAWKAGDYPSAFDNLHRYFDYTMHTRDKTFYQYALLNLALLHADFECYSEAIAAMHESITTARENKDVNCLNYSLSWLYHLGKAHPEELSEVQKSGVLGTDKEALSFLKAKAKGNGQWGLLSTSLMSETKLALTNGESLATAFETMTKVSHLNLMKNLTTAFGNQMLLESSLFHRLGVSYLAWSKTEIFQTLYQDDSPAEDTLNFACRRAAALASKGGYEQALALMDEVSSEELRPVGYQQYWTAHMGLLKLEHALHRGDLVAADHYLSQLRAHPSSNHDIDFAIGVLEITQQLRQRDYPLAMSLLEKHMERISTQEGDIYKVTKLMILKARIFDKAQAPQKGFSVAIRACNLAHHARILPVLWEGIIALCRILNSLKEFVATRKLLSSIMPQVLECEDCELAAMAFSCMADAHMGMAGREKAGSVKRKEQTTRTLEYLEQAFDEWSKVGNAEEQGAMMAKRALIMRLTGDLALANDYAAKCLDIQKGAKEETNS